MTEKMTSQLAMELEAKYGAHNYHPLPVVLAKGKGAKVWDVCMKMKENGVLAKPTHHHIIRFAPPLVITEEELRATIGIIKETILSF